MFFVCILQKMKFSCRANKKAAGFSRRHIGVLICRICNFFLDTKAFSCLQFHWKKKLSVLSSRSCRLCFPFWRPSWLGAHTDRQCEHKIRSVPASRIVRFAYTKYISSARVNSALVLFCFPKEALFLSPDAKSVLRHRPQPKLCNISW